MAAILADATNMGLDRMAESSRGLTIHQLNLMIDRHVRPETYAAALAALVDAQHAEPFAALWGPGTTSSSDGQFFPAGGRGEASSDYNARQGPSPARVLRLHLRPLRVLLLARDRRRGQRGALRARRIDAPRELRSRSMSTRPRPVPSKASALAHAFGYRFAPRIRDLGDASFTSPTQHGRRAARRRVRRRDQPRRHRGQLGRRCSELPPPFTPAPCRRRSS